MNNTRRSPDGYEKKFAEFIRLCEVAKTKSVKNVVIAMPWVIGDNYEEVMESLSRLAEAGLVLHIAEPLRNTDPRIPGKDLN